MANLPTIGSKGDITASFAIVLRTGRRGARLLERPQFASRLEASADRHRHLVTLEAVFIVGETVFTAHIGLPANSELAARAKAVAVEILGKAVVLDRRLQASVSVSALDVEIGIRRNRKASANAGVKVAACLHLGDILIAFLHRGFGGFDVDTKRNAGRYGEVIAG